MSTDRLGTLRHLLRCMTLGARALCRSPAFAVTALASLAVGIGANVLVFGLLDLTLLKPLPFRDPDRLVVIRTAPEDDPGQLRTSNASSYLAISQRADASFESIGAFNGGACGVRALGTDDGSPAQRLYGQTVSASLFDTLGVVPAAGRAIVEEDVRVDGAAPVMLISHGVWQQRFGGDPSIVGRTVELDRKPTTIVGVLPRQFSLFGYSTDFIAPLCLTRAQVESRVGGLTIVGRLERGTSIAMAQAEIDRISRDLGESDPARHAGLVRTVQPLRRAAYGEYTAPLLVLQVAVALVLLIACANVAGLLLARASERRDEIATRVALGAGRWRVAAQLVAESVPLGVLGGVLGLLLAWIGLRAFARAAPPGFPRLAELSMSGTTMWFTALVVTTAMLLCALVPAVRAAKLASADCLRSTSRGTTESAQGIRAMNALVSIQLALAVVLLVGTGLMIGSLARAMSNDIGADPTGVLMFDLRMPREETIAPGGTYRGVGLWNVSPAPASLVERVLERLEQLPGVEVGAATSPPLTPALPAAFLLEGQAPAPPDQPMQDASASRQTVGYRAITRGFFDAMDIPVTRGRDLDRRDTAESPRVVLVNETFSNRYFPGDDAIGQRIRLDLVPDPQLREIVGVVGDTLDDPMQQAPEPAVYVPHVQQPRQWPGPYWPVRAGMYFVVRTIGAPMSALPTVTAAVAEVAPDVPVADATTVEDVLYGHVAETTTYSRLLGLFGAIAAALAATGVYGTMTYSIARRRRDLGIRVALGGTGWNVAGTVLRQMGLVLVAGLSIGLIGALALTRGLASALFEVTATVAPIYLAVAALLTLIASLACIAPVYRAVNVDPAAVLRSE